MPTFRAVIGPLELIAFVGGAAVMVLEITGSRILAPYLGTSLIVWTTLIGTIMASLSAGYWWGGRMADRAPTYVRLAAILTLAGAFALFTAIGQQPILGFLQTLALDLHLYALTATLILFAPASVLLGMVTPFVARLKLQSIETAGTHVGRLYAISTAGSIGGTFAAGYFLLGVMGSSRILYAIAAVLFLLSLVAAAQWRVAQRGSLFVFLALAFLLAEYERSARAESGFLDFDTAYQRVFIIDTQEEGTSRPIRLLHSEDGNAQSSIYLDSHELLEDYLKCFSCVLSEVRPRKALMIGAAGYAFPRWALQEMPELQMDVIEIDPAMTTLAEQYFQFRPDPRVRIFHEDGRTFVNRRGDTYDAILIDAFQTHVPPFQLLTEEFVRNLESRLSPEGVVLLNLIGAADNKQDGLANAIVATYRMVFHDVRILRVDAAKPLDQRQNLILVASRSAQPPRRDDAQHATVCPTHNTQDWSGRVLTDNFAPVEMLVGGFNKRR